MTPTKTPKMPYYCGGLDDLAVATGEGLVKIEEYDRSESVCWKNADEGWL